MACRFDRPHADAIWPALLASRRFLASPESDGAECVYFARTKAGWAFRTEPDDADATVRVPLEGVSVDGISLGGVVDPACRTLLRLYLPLILGGYHARRRGEVFVTAHVAQSLDGRIACTNGHSQWISNEANLFHAHRLRALHDAVVIGGTTVATDDPQLTVRHVEGDDPTRVILSATGSVLELAEERKVFDASGSIVLCTRAARERIHVNGRHGHVDVLALESEDAHRIDPEVIAEALADRGLHSAFLEGGSKVLSSFLHHGRIDVLHVHVAPMILGSGVASFSLPEVTDVKDGRQLRMEHFEMEGELLFECHLPSDDRSPTA